MEPIVTSKLAYHSSRLLYVTSLKNNLHTHRLKTSELQFPPLQVSTPLNKPKSNIHTYYFNKYSIDLSSTDKKFRCMFRLKLAIIASIPDTYRSNSLNIMHLKDHIHLTPSYVSTYYV